MILVRYVLLLGVLFFVQVTAKAEFIDSVAYYKKQLFNPKKPIDSKIKTYYNLFNYYETTNPKLASNYFNRAYLLSRKYQSRYGKGWYHKIKAYSDLTAGNINAGIYHSQSAAAYFKAIKDTINFVESNYFAAYGFQLNQQQQAAKQLLLSSLKMLPPNRFYKQQGMLYSSLSYLENEHDLVQSLDYLMKSKTACLKANNISGLYSVYSDLSLFYSNIDDYQTALYYAKQSLYCVKKTTPIVHFDLATVTSNVAAMFIALKRYPSALYYLNQSLVAAKKVNSRVFEEKGMLYKIEIFLAMKRYDQAEKSLRLLNKKQLDPISLFHYHLFSLKLNSALERFDRSNQHIVSCDSIIATGLTLTKTIQLNYYDVLQTYFQQNGEKEKQVDALNSYYQLKIAQLEQQKDYRLIRLQLKSINAEKQFAQRALEQQLLKTRAITRSKHNERTYFLISVSFLIVILFFISWSIYLYRKRNKQLREFNQVLEELVADKEVLLQEIHHRVKNNFQIINSILAIQGRQKSSSKETFLAQFSTRIHSMAFVHDKLYGAKVVGQHNAVTFLRELLEHSCATFPSQTLKMELIVSGKPIFLPIEQLLPMGLIVNELTVNSLKYAFSEQEKGTIAIDVDQNERSIFVSFQDNGKGKIDPQVKYTGLIVVDAFVMKLKGTVVVTNDKGLHYQFEFPKRLVKE